jgi:hypothetical protein
MAENPFKYAMLKADYEKLRASDPEFFDLLETLAKIGRLHKLASSWSVEGADDVFAPHPYAGAHTVSFDCDPFWGVGGIYKAPIQGPRWLDLWIAANDCLVRSGDVQHRFIEGFEPDGNGELVIGTGS